MRARRGMRVQLVMLSLAVSSLLVLAFVVPLAALVRSRAQDQAFDDAEADIAALVPVIAVTDDPAVLEAAVATLRTDDGRVVSITGPDGVILGRPPSAVVDQALQEARSVFEERNGNLEIVRVVQSGANDLVAVSVTVPRDVRFRGVGEAWAGLGIAGFLLITLGVVMNDRLARGMVRSVQSLSSEARRLGAGDLSARVEPSGGQELYELGETFNLLGSRVEDMLVRERTMLSDMSHRLRTPLTRLRLRIDQLDDPGLAAALHDDLTETTDTLTEIIRESRQSIDDRQADDARCDAAEVLAERLAFWQVLADDEQRPIDDEIEHASVPAAIDEAALEEVLDVLLDNVFSHTPPGTGLDVRLTRSETDCTITIVNDVVGGPSTSGSQIGHRIATDRSRSVGGSFRAGEVDGRFEAVLVIPRARGVFGPV